MSQLLVIFYAAWTPHSYLYASTRISVPLQNLGLKHLGVYSFYQKECGKPPQVPVGGQRVNTRCVFREKLHLRFQVAYKDKLSVHESISEAVQIPGSLQVPDSSAKHRRYDGVTVNSNFCEREQILSATGPFSHRLHHCTVLQYLKALKRE